MGNKYLNETGLVALVKLIKKDMVSNSTISALEQAIVGIAEDNVEQQEQIDSKLNKLSKLSTLELDALLKMD